MTSRTAVRARPPHGGQASRASRTGARRAARQAYARTARRRNALLWGVVVAGVVALIAAMLWSARSTSDATSRPAPDFVLTNTNGTTVRLAGFRGRNVVLYFNEGAGCQACLLQMVDIERNAAQFAAANVTVLPIVMNTAEQIKADMAANGVRTPFLIDDGAVSAAYGTLGKGMHEGLPGHSFVLIDAEGTQRWYGEYPSMFLSSADLLDQIRRHLP
ncbi:MAG TPA: peroxiredoxin family protein [Micromonosporaceae bacterium]|nr:peroxiredoxin family protein [Micromonosporaceae bacterium]